MIFHTITQLPIEDKKLSVHFSLLFFYLKTGRTAASGMIGYTQLLTTADHFYSEGSEINMAISSPGSKRSSSDQGNGKKEAIYP